MDKSQETKITLIIVTLDYHMKRAKRHSKYRCHYDQNTLMIEIKERMLEKINRDPTLSQFTIADLFVTLVLTEIANDSMEIPLVIGNKEKVSLVFLDDFLPLSSYMNDKRVDRKKTYVRLIIRESSAAK